MLDFEIANNQLYLMTTGVLGRHYDDMLYKAGALNLTDESRAEIRKAFDLLLDKIEELQSHKGTNAREPLSTAEIKNVCNNGLFDLASMSIENNMILQEQLAIQREQNVYLTTLLDDIETLLHKRFEAMETLIHNNFEKEPNNE